MNLRKYFYYFSDLRMVNNVIFFPAEINKQFICEN